MRLASDPENVIAETCSESESEHGSNDIDDVKTLQERMGIVKTSEREGYVDRQSGMSRFSYKPLSIRKTRIGNCF